MSNKGQHVTPNPKGGWSVRQSGAVRATRVFGTQAAAVEYAREKARKEGGDLYVHRADGTIGERDTYGVDPYASRRQS
jgi:hypothetical protein